MRFGSRSKQRTSLSVLLSVSVLASSVLGALPAGAADPEPGTPYNASGEYDASVPHVVINQIYGVGTAAANGGFVSHGFAELYNPTDEDIDLSGWSLQYADRGNNTTTGATLAWEMLALTGTIKANSSYLVVGEEAGPDNERVQLEVWDQMWSGHYFNNKGMKVALVSNQTLLTTANPFAADPRPAGYVDMVGTGSNDGGSTIDGYEGDYPTGSSGGTSKKKAIRRVNYADSDNNKNDFVQVDYEDADANQLEAWIPRTTAVRITTDVLEDALVGVPYSATVRAVGGTGPYTYEATGLPDGLTIGETTGVISGTPTTSGQTSVTVKATDQKATEATTDEPIELNVVAMTVTARDLPEAKVGEPYSSVEAAVEVNGGAIPYTYAATDLPEGLTIDDETGIISGIPAAGAAGDAEITVTVTDSVSPTPNSDSAEVTLTIKPEPAYDNVFELNKLAEYSVGETNEDGGVAEIVKYNKENGKFYVVNGSGNPPSLDIVTLGVSGTLTKDATIAVKTLSEAGGGFVYGDLTSVDVNTATDRIYVSVQAEAAGAPGKILALDYNGNLLATYATGIQPDMIKSTPDGRYVLTADEGEPRDAANDPEGSVTIVDTQTGTSTQVKFTDTSVIDDNVHIRSPEETGGLIVGKGSKADALFDLEPEYIALSADYKKAYVTLQENNAIATIDIENAEVLSVKGLGLKDYDDPANALDLVGEKAILFENVPFYGVYMPDGLASHTIGGQTYLLTANEGDATEWDDFDGGRANVSTIKDQKSLLDDGSDAKDFLSDKGTTYDKVEVMTDWGTDGIYMYGGRSFSIWNADTLAQVYDSGSDFERITAERLPQYFNASNSNETLDSRSTKKGPEPEDVKTGQVGDKVFAFIGLERVGGIAAYDISVPQHPEFVSYVNTRNFTESNDTTDLRDSAPEGLDFIPATDSPTGRPLLLVAFEVGGTVGVFELNVTKVSLNNKHLSLTLGQTSSKLTAAVEPVGGGAATVTWTSSNSSVAAVDSHGNVTPVSSGQATITALSADGYGSAVATVSVSPAQSGGDNNGGGTTTPDNNTPSDGGNGEPTASSGGPVTGSDGSTTVTAEATAVVDASGAAEVSFQAKQLSASLQNLTGAAASGGAAVLELKVVIEGNPSSAKVKLPAASFTEIADSSVSAVSVDAGIGKITFDKAALGAVSSAAASQGDVEVSIRQLSAAELGQNLDSATNRTLAQVVGSRPVFDFTVMAGGGAVSNFAGGTVNVSVPYTPAADEDLNAIVVYYLSDDGKLTIVPNGVYNPETGMLEFGVGHFSKYAVGYNKVQFSDIGASFAADSITYLSARGIIAGVGGNRFAPSGQVTRADFALMLARLAGADTAGGSGGAFADVPADAYYAGAVNWAAEQGIASGVGGGVFEPGANITRAQMVTMIGRFIDKLGYTLPLTQTATTFADAAAVPAYAREALTIAQRAGIVGGRASSGGTGPIFAPNDEATRAETAKMLAVLMQKLKP